MVESCNGILCSLTKSEYTWWKEKWNALAGIAQGDFNSIDTIFICIFIYNILFLKLGGRGTLVFTLLLFIHFYGCLKYFFINLTQTK